MDPLPEASIQGGSRVFHQVSTRLIGMIGISCPVTPIYSLLIDLITNYQYHVLNLILLFPLCQVEE